VYAEILKNRPLSGEFEEVNFGKSNHSLWVKFTDDEFIEWLGKFDIGWKNGFGIFEEKTNEPVILAGGILYKVDVKRRKLIFSTEENDIQGAIFYEKKDKIIANNDFKISIYSIDGKLEFSTERVSVGGIIFDKIENEIVFGRLNDLPEQWNQFTFDVEKRKFNAKWWVLKDHWPSGT